MSEALRVDKWLWQARFFKTRTLAAKTVASGAVRVNSVRIAKPSVMVRQDDVLTFAQGDRIRVARIIAIGTRRGPAAEAQTLYEDLSPPTEPRERQTRAPSFEGKGRPTKKDRRDWENKRGMPT